MNIMSPKWWISTIIQTFVIMCFIYIIKVGTSKVDIPVVSKVAQEV